jgi:class 3 adenylate cyclase
VPDAALLSKIRHDLKTPLNHIIGYAEMLLEDAEAAEATQTAMPLRRLVEHAQACLDLQQRLLARDASQLRLEDWAELRRGQCEHGAGMTDILAELRAEPLAGQWSADLDRLGQAVENLENLAVRAPAQWASAEPAPPPPSPPASVTAAPAATPEPALAASGVSRSATLGRLLVVDDNEANRDMLSRRLEREGYAVVTAANGRQALEQLAMGERRFDLVLLDIMMPELDGFAVLQRIRANPLWKGVAVIMISAVDEIKSVVRCIEMGAEDYLQKPFDPVLLRARIGAIVERHKLRDDERRRSLEMEAMLRNILPEKVAAELRTRGTVEPMYFEDVTIGFTDFVGFTRSTENLAAEEIVGLLHEYFTAFDRIASRYGLEKLKTIGDSYMFVSGMPERNPSHPVDAVLAALEMVEAVRRMARPEEGIDWQVRIGLHTGPVIAGVVGIHKFAFDIWGESVNFASRMESSGAANRVNLSERTYSRVKDFIRCSPRGAVSIKDGREVEMYFADGVHPKLVGGDGAVPAAFSRRYGIYFRQPVRAFPEFLLPGA